MLHKLSMTLCDFLHKEDGRSPLLYRLAEVVHDLTFDTHTYISKTLTINRSSKIARI